MISRTGAICRGVVCGRRWRDPSQSPAATAEHHPASVASAEEPGLGRDGRASGCSMGGWSGQSAAAAWMEEEQEPCSAGRRVDEASICHEEMHVPNVRLRAVVPKSGTETESPQMTLRGSSRHSRVTGWPEVPRLSAPIHRHQTSTRSERQSAKPSHAKSRKHVVRLSQTTRFDPARPVNAPPYWPTDSLGSMEVTENSTTALLY